MSNPWDILGEPEHKPQALPEFEEVSGAMSCQFSGCFEVVNNGKYFPTEKLLTWKCSQGHKSKIVDIDL